MQTSNKLRHMPIGKLIIVMSVPAMFSMLIQSLYNIVDSIYVSKLGPTALNAVSLAFPMQMLIIAFALGIGIGTSSYISRKMGERKIEEANQVAKTGIILAVIMGLIFIIVGLTLSRPFLSLMSSDQEAIELGTQYLNVVMGLSIFVFIEITATKILQGVGNMIVPMLCQLVGAITNIILDPIFIFNLELGVKGAAIATVIGQFMAMLLAVGTFVFRKQEISISLRNFKFKKEYLFKILNVGLPVTIMNSVASITTTILNSLLTNSYVDPELGKAAVNVLGIYFKLQSFIFMPIFGINQGGIPILAYNYGANIKKRFTKALGLMICIAFVIMIIGFSLFQIMPLTLLSLFHPNENMIYIGKDALRIISLSFFPAAFSIIFGMSFQALGHGFKSLLMSLFRQLIILIPSAYIISKISLSNIWYAYVIAEIMACIVFVPIAIHTINKAFRLKAIAEPNLI